MPSHPSGTLLFGICMPGMEALVVGIVIAGMVARSALDRFVPKDWVQPTRPYEELKTEVGSLISFGRGVILAVLGLVCVLSTLGFVAAESLVSHRLSDAVFVLAVQPILFGLPSLFIGLATALLLERPIDRWIAKERYWDVWFVSYRNRHPNSPPPGASEYLAERRGKTLGVPILAAGGLVACCLMLDMYAYVTPTQIVVNPLFGFEEHHHSFAEVESINTRYIRSQLECRIAFKNDSTLSSAPSELSNRQIDALATYVSERTAAPWTHDPHP
jgi:hypothetical protein